MPRSPFGRVPNNSLDHSTTLNYAEMWSYLQRYHPIKNSPCNLECTTYGDKPLCPLLASHTFQGSSEDYPVFSALQRAHMPCATHHPNAHCMACLVANSFLLWSPARQVRALENLRRIPFSLISSQHHPPLPLQPLQPSRLSSLPFALLRMIMGFLPASVQARCRLVEKQMAVQGDWAVTQLVVRVEVVGQVDGLFLPKLPDHKLPQSINKHLLIDMRLWNHQGNIRALIAAAVPFLGGMKSLSLKGPLGAVAVSLEVLSAGSTLSGLTELDLDGTAIPFVPTHTNPETLSIVNSIRKCTGLLALKTAGVHATFGQISAALVATRLTRLAVEVRQWGGDLLCVHDLTHLHLTFDSHSQGLLTRPWERCLDLQSCPSLTHCELTHKSFGGYVDPTEVRIESRVMNIMMRWIGPLVPHIQSFTVDNITCSDPDSVELERETVVLMCAQNCLKTFAVGSMPEPGLLQGLTLGALTHLSCCCFDMQQLALTPVVTSLSIYQMMEVLPQNLPLRISKFHTSQYDTSVLPISELVDFGIVLRSILDVTYDEYEARPGAKAPISFAGFDSLKRFTLRTTVSYGIFPTILNQYLAALQGAEKLSHLELHNCQLTLEADEELIQRFASLLELTHVSLHQCLLSEEVVRSIAGLPKMLQLEIVRCIGISRKDCRRVHQSHTGPAAFGLLFR